MIEYPTIINSSKAPRLPCYAFDKIDGSNIRIKYTQKKGFCLFGSRTTLFDETHEHLGEAIPCFRRRVELPMKELIRNEFPNEREIIVFAEFWGEKSFAGIHVKDDPKALIVIDILVGHKNPKFVLPQHFMKLSERYGFPRPRLVYVGNLNEEFIKDVRANAFSTNEGVICKGTERRGEFRGGMWQCKIKTQAYLDRLVARFGKEGLEKYGE